MRRVLRSAPLCALLLTACAPQYASIAMGNYAEFRPYARMLSNSIEMELARPAYVAVIGIVTPAPAYQERPVLFQPLYPLYDTDETHFEAGKHRLLPRPRSLRDPPNCRRDEKPSLGGCRRLPYMYPGAGAPNEIASIYQPDAMHYLVIASEEFIDAFTLAEDLFDMAYERDELGQALKTRNADKAGLDLERALLDRPGSPIWGAFYVAGK